MSYRLAADALVWLHLGFILFVLFGGLLPLRWPRLAWLHLPAVAWGCAVEFLGLPCPLTPLENRLRRAAGDAGYSGLGAIVLLVNLIAYLYLWHRRSSR